MHDFVILCDRGDAFWKRLISPNVLRMRHTIVSTKCALNYMADSQTYTDNVRVRLVFAGPLGKWCCNSGAVISRLHFLRNQRFCSSCVFGILKAIFRAILSEHRTYSSFAHGRKDTKAGRCNFQELVYFFARWWSRQVMTSATNTH